MDLHPKLHEKITKTKNLYEKLSKLLYMNIRTNTIPYIFMEKVYCVVIPNFYFKNKKIFFSLIF